MDLKVIYEDEDLIAINKSAGIMVHKTNITEDKVFLLQLLRDQINQRVYPIHRLDRGTSGVLLFGKHTEEAARVQKLMMANQFEKKYLAIVRGFVDEEGTIDYPLKSGRKNLLQDAISHYKRIDQQTLDFEVNRYPTSRYSLVEVRPETGKFHQIRRHFAHIRHPIIGDKKHGDCKHNKYFAETQNFQNMCLHAREVVLSSSKGTKLSIEAELPQHFLFMMKHLNLRLTSESR